MRKLFCSALFVSCTLLAQTAQYPTALATTSDLLIAKNRAQTVTTASFNATTLTIPVQLGTVFTAPTDVTIDNEIIKICTVATSSLTACVGGRGFDNSTAASHTNATQVLGNINAWYHNAMAAEIIALESYLGINCALCGGGGGGNVNWETNSVSTATGTGTANFVAGNGITLTGTNPASTYRLSIDANTAILQSRELAQSGVSTRCVSSTGTDSYACVLTPTLTTYTANGTCLTLYPDTANTGAASLNVDLLGIRPILTKSGATPTTGDIPAFYPTQVCMDATASNFILLNATGSGSVTSIDLTGTANQITVDGASPITTSGLWNLHFPTAGVTLPGVTNLAAGSSAAPSLQWPHTGGGKLGFYKFDNLTLSFPDMSLRFEDTGTPTRYLQIQAQNIDIPQTIASAADITWYNAAGPGSGNVVALLSDTNLLFGPFTGGALNTGIVRDDTDSGILRIARADKTLQTLRFATQSPGDNTTKGATTAFVTAAVTGTPCTTCVTSAASLTANNLIIGAGSQAAAALGTLGTTTTVLHGNAGGAPTFGQVNLATDVTGTLPTSAQAASGLVRTCEIVIGDPSSTSVALANDNDTPAVCVNATGATMTITAVACYADAGSPTVTPIITGGGGTTILTGALTCGNGAYTSGTLNGTPTQTNGQTIDGNITSAGGTAKYIVIRIVRTL